MLLGVSWLIIPQAAANNIASGTVTQSYSAGSSVLPTMIVEFKPKDKTTVVPLNSNDMSNMLGVVIPPNNATIVLMPQTVSNQQVLVAPNGRYNVLVSNQNGPIKTGDYLTISAIPGVSMKASTNQPLIIGHAVGNFNGTSNIGEVSLKNSQNATVHVTVGRIAVDVQLAPNPLYLKSSNSVLVFLTRAEYSVTNKPVSTLRTYLVGLVFLATVLVSVVILYSGTKSAMISIGRNPLAKSAIGRAMLKTIVAGVLVFAAGTAMVYFILNR